MSFRNDGFKHPFVAGSAVGQGVAVQQSPVASSRDEVVFPAASSGQETIGITYATQATYGREVAVILDGIAKVRLAASVGAGQWVAPASTNGALGPALPSGVLASFGASAGLQLARFAVGRTLEAGDAGEYVAIVVAPRQVI